MFGTIENLAWYIGLLFIVFVVISVFIIIGIVSFIGKLEIKDNKKSINKINKKKTLGNSLAFHFTLIIICLGLLLYELIFQADAPNLIVILASIIIVFNSLMAIVKQYGVYLYNHNRKFIKKKN